MLFLQTLQLKPDAKPRIAKVYPQCPEALIRMKNEFNKFREYGFVIEASSTWSAASFEIKNKTGNAHRHKFRNLNSQLVPFHVSPPGLWSRNPSNYGQLEPGPKITDGGAGAWNLGSASTDILCWGKWVVKTLQWVLLINEPNRSGVGVKTSRCWSRNQKF